MDQISEQHSGMNRAKSGLTAMALARLPRILGVTILAMVVAFIGAHMLPTKYKASLDLPVTIGADPSGEIEQILAPLQLAESVARLPDVTVLELRRQGEDTLDSTALLRRQLTVSPSADGGQMRLEAVAASPEHARAMVEAIAAGYQQLDQAMPQALAVPSDTVSVPEAVQAEPQTQPVAHRGATDASLLQQRMTLAWENRIRLEEKAARIETLIAAGNFSALAMQAEGLPGLGRRLDELAMLESEREKLAVTLLPNHPTMRALVEQIAQVNGEVVQQSQELAALARADSEAALRLETGLQAQYEAQLASADVDTSVLTASITPGVDVEVTQLPRPINPVLALLLSGGLAFFGQLGLIGLQQPRPFPQSKGEFDLPETIVPPLDDIEQSHRQVHVPEPVHQPADAPLPPERSAPTPVEHNWLAASAPEVPVMAQWMGMEQPAAPAAPASADAQWQEEAPTQSPADPLAGLDTARIVAIRATGSHSDTSAWARDLLDAYADDGRRVVLIDAASRRRGSAPGISDLSLGRARFADIVHGTGINEAALIPWGRQDTLYASARPVRTLLLALVELYDVVVITLDADASGSSHLADMADFVLPATPRSKRSRAHQRVSAQL